MYYYVCTIIRFAIMLFTWGHLTIFIHERNMSSREPTVSTPFSDEESNVLARRGEAERRDEVVIGEG